MRRPRGGRGAARGPGGRRAAGARGGAGELAAGLLAEALGAKARERHAGAAQAPAGGAGEPGSCFPPVGALEPLPRGEAPPAGLDARSGLVLGLAARAGLEAFPADDVEAAVLALEKLRGAAGLAGLVALAASMARQCPEEQLRGRTLCLHRLVLRGALGALCGRPGGEEEPCCSGMEAAVEAAAREVRETAAAAAAAAASAGGGTPSPSAEGLRRGLGAACLEAGELLMARRHLAEAARHLACAAQLLQTGAREGEEGEGPRGGGGGGVGGTAGGRLEARLRACTVACRSILPPDAAGVLPAVAALAAPGGTGGADAPEGDAALTVAELHSRILGVGVDPPSASCEHRPPQLWDSGSVSSEPCEQFLRALGSPDAPTFARCYEEISNESPESASLLWLAACLRRAVLAATDPPHSMRLSEEDFGTLFDLAKRAPGSDLCDLEAAEWTWRARVGAQPASGGEGEAPMQADSAGAGSLGPDPLAPILLKFGRPPCPRIWCRSLAYLVDAGASEGFKDLEGIFKGSQHPWQRTLLEAAVLLTDIVEACASGTSPAEGAGKEAPQLPQLSLKLLGWIAETSQGTEGERGSQAALRAVVSFMREAPRLQVLTAVSFCLLDRMSPQSGASKLAPDCAGAWVQQFQSMRGASPKVAGLKSALAKQSVSSHVLVQKSLVRRFVRFLVERLRASATRAYGDLREEGQQKEEEEDGGELVWTPGLWHWTQCLGDLSLDSGFHRECLELYLGSLEEVARSHSDWARCRAELHTRRPDDGVGSLFCSRALRQMARACSGLQLRSAAAALLCWDDRKPDREAAAEVLDGPLPAMPYEEPFLECLWDLPTLELLSEKAEQARMRLPESPNAEALQAAVLGLIKRPMLAHFAPAEVRRQAIGVLQHRLLLRLFAWVSLPAGWPAVGERREALPEGMQLLVQLVEQFAADHANPTG